MATRDQYDKDILKVLKSIDNSLKIIAKHSQTSEPHSLKKNIVGSENLMHVYERSSDGSNN